MDPITLALANQYTADTAAGMGAVQGKPGKDGFSPTVAVSEIAGGHNVTITDASGPHSFDVMDGESGSGTGEDSFVTFKDQTISTPSELQTAIGHRPYYGCIHAINTRILGIAFTNDIVWISYKLISGTYYLDLVTADGLCEAWSSAGFSDTFSSISSTKFLLEDELDLAEGTTFIGYFISPPEVNSTVSMHPDWFIGKKPTVGEQYRGKARNNVNKWWDMVVNVVGTFDNEGITMYTVEVVSVTEIGELPTGGAAGQILSKKTATDYDTEWIDAPQGGGGDSTVLVKSPIGTIVIWSGTVDNIPTGWQLCDGTNGTPDLRDKFVLGAGTKHAVGETGGSEEVTLTVEQMPEHNHLAKLSSGDAGVLNIPLKSNNSSWSNYNYSEPSGSSQPHPNMPPYYALCYIMKLTADETDAPDISVDDTLTKSPTNELSVTTPVKTFVTQDEYDALSEEEKSKGLYVVVTPEATSMEWFSPKMTDASSPVPYVATASSELIPAWKAFDDDETTASDMWHSSDTVNSWILFDFGIKTNIRGIEALPSVSNASSYPNAFPKHFTVYGSLDGIAFEKIYETAALEDDTYSPTTHTHRVLKFTPDKSYRYYKIVCGGNYMNSNYAVIQNIRFYISVDKETYIHGLSINGEEKLFSDGGVTIDQVNSAIDTKLDAYEPQEVYSTEETRIGTWIDGKPLYRKVYTFTSPISISSSYTDSKIIFSLDSYIMPIKYCTYILHGGKNAVSMCQLADVPRSESIARLFIEFGKVYLVNTFAEFANKPIRFILEYTKTTDQAQTASANTVLKAPSKAPAVNSIPSAAVTASGITEIDNIQT